MAGRETEELRERARRCRELAVGYDDRVGATLIELAEELEKRAAELEAAPDPAADRDPDGESLKIHPPLGNMR